MSRYPLAIIIFWVLGFFVTGPMARAFPEMSRFGYFSCSTCHVSPSGGSLLTPYGRSIAVEKLSTWGEPAEGLPLHGLGASKGSPPPSDGAPRQPWLPSWLLLGGDLRMMQLDFQNADRQDGRWIRMQSDLTVGLVLPKATFVLSGGPRGEIRSRPDLSGKISFRQYYIKSDLGDTSLRLGRFYPKFGLGIPQHHTFVRRNLGFDQGQENLNGELTWFAETHEVTLTRMMGARKQEADGSDEKGYSLGYAYFLSGKHRIGINGLTGKNPVQSRQVVGVFGSFALSEKWFLLAEENRQTIRPIQGNPYDQIIFYHRLGYEVIQGLIPSLIVEGIAPQIRDLKTRRESIGMGVQWFPRPHFDIDSMVGMTLNHSDYSFSTTAYIIGHYYL
jgi:hypothetical protein